MERSSECHCIDVEKPRTAGLSNHTDKIGYLVVRSDNITGLRTGSLKELFEALLARAAYGANLRRLVAGA